MKFWLVVRHIQKQHNYLYVKYLIRILRYNKTPKTSLQLKKRGFNLNSYVQDTKNPQFPAQLHIFFPNATVRNVLRPVSRERSWKDISGGPLGRTGKILWAWGIQKGPEVHLLPKGKLALMFLKHYGCCSDRRLMEQLNGNLDWQFFCDIYLGADRLDNFKMISEIRCELAGKLDMDKVQRAFYGHWSPHMKDKGSIAMDATCYESHLRYPPT